MRIKLWSLFVSVIVFSVSFGGDARADQRDRLDALEKHLNVASNVVEAFRDGVDVLEVYVTVKGFDVDPPFYRPVIDDPSERREKSFEAILALLDNEIAQRDIVTIYPHAGLGLFRLT